MIKNIHRRKLSRTSSHRRALLRNMSASLFLHEKIKTTLPKARELSSFAERLLTAASAADAPARRKISAEIKDAALRKKIFEVLVPRFAAKSCGRVAVYKAGHRKSDNAAMAVVTLL